MGGINVKRSIFIFLSIVLVVAGYLLINSWKNEQYPMADEYFPNKIMTKRFSGGYENEGFTQLVEKIENGKVQIKVKDTAIDVVTVYEVSHEEIKLIYALEDDGDLIEVDLSSLENNREEVLIKAPIKKGAKWQNPQGGKYEITGIDIKVNTPAGDFNTIEISYKTDSYEVKRYYAKGIGLVKSENEYGITDELISIEDGINEVNNSDFGVKYGEKYVFLNQFYHSLDDKLGIPISRETIVLGQGSDTFSGSHIRTSYYDGLTVEEFSPKGEGKDNFWIYSLYITNENYSTTKGVTIGDKLEKLKTEYPNIEVLKDGRTDEKNCAYLLKDPIEPKYIIFEVKDSTIEWIKIYYELQ